MGNFTAVSTDSFNGKNIDKKHLVAENVDFKVTSTSFLGIPIGGIVKMDEAISETLAEHHGDFLKNVQVNAYAWSVIIFGQQGYKIEADVYKTEE